MGIYANHKWHTVKTRMRCDRMVVWTLVWNEKYNIGRKAYNQNAFPLWIKKYLKYSNQLSCESFSSVWSLGFEKCGKKLLYHLHILFNICLAWEHFRYLYRQLRLCVFGNFREADTRKHKHFRMYKITNMKTTSSCLLESQSKFESCLRVIQLEPKNYSLVRYLRRPYLHVQCYLSSSIFYLKCNPLTHLMFL